LIEILSTNFCDTSFVYLVKQRWALLMCIEHENTAIERAAAILRAAPLKFVRPSTLFNSCPLGLKSEDPRSDVANAVPHNMWIPLMPPESSPVHTESTISSVSSSPPHHFVWSHEHNFRPDVPDGILRFARYLTSNREFFDFIQRDGYMTKRWWSDAGWAWVQENQKTKPHFWRIHQESQQCRLRVLAEEIAMPWDWPVEVCNYEADAFCAFKSEIDGQPIRLPTESEYLRLRANVKVDVQNSEAGIAWACAPGNINLERWGTPCPVNTFVDPASGFADIVGNVWTHTSSQLTFSDESDRHWLAPALPKEVQDGQHVVLRSGSCLARGGNACASRRFHVAKNDSSFCAGYI
jgi:hypothetical protein